MQEQIQDAETEDKGTRFSGRIGFLEVAISLVCYLAVSVVTAVILASLGYDLLNVQDTTMWLWLVAGAAVAPLVAVGAAVAVRVRSFAAVGLRRVSGRWLWIGAGFGLLAWATNRGVVLLYFWATGDTSNPQAGIGNTAVGGSIAQFALLVVLAGLIVPFGEELLFRGVVYTWLRRWGVVLATIASALIFGIFHGVNVVLPAAIVLGVINAILYERSGSIWPAVVAHAVNNTLIFVLTRVLFESGLVSNL